jgi:ATP-dependent Clp protease ATP-binding subunit ClpB
MDLNKLTQKSQEALSDAQNKAITRGHTEVDGEHLLLALIEQEQGLIPRLLQKIDVPADAVRTAVETELEQRPRISGPGVEPGKIYLSQRL